MGFNSTRNIFVYGFFETFDLVPYMSLLSLISDKAQSTIPALDTVLELSTTIIIFVILHLLVTATHIAKLGRAGAYKTANRVR